MPDETHKLDRRSILLGTTAAAVTAAVAPSAQIGRAQAQTQGTPSAPAAAGGNAAGKKPNILIIWGDDVGI